MRTSSRFIDYANNLSRACMDQKKIIYGLLILLGFLSAVLVYMALQRTAYLIPYNLNEKIAISINKVSPEYLSSLAMADAATYFNVDRYNVGAQTQLFLSRVDPGFMVKAGIDLNQRKKQILSNNISQVFYPLQFYVKKNTRFVILKGRLVKWLSSKLVHSRIIKLSVDYSNINGHVFIKKWMYTNA